MNKFKYTLAVIAALGILSGCQNSSQPKTEDVRKSILTQEKRIGIIQSLGGAAVSNKATHLLRMDDGKTFYLRGEGVDLTNSKYISRKVEVMGEIIRTTDGNQVMAVKNVDIVDTNSDITADIPQWVEYVSENTGIKLKYRDDYKITEAGNELEILSQKAKEIAEMVSTDDSMDTSEFIPASIKIELLSSADDFDLSKAMGLEDLSPSSLLDSGFSKSKVTQSALDAYKKSSGDGKEITFYLQSGPSFKISFTAGSDPSTLMADQNMFYEVLSSMEIGDGADSDGDFHLENEDHEMEVSEHVSDETAVDNKEETDETKEVASNVDGYEEFKSENQKFSIYYPKGYYFGAAGSVNSGASRSYDFGTQPLEEVPASIKLDIVSGSAPAGKSLKIGENQLVVVENGSSNSYYVQSGSRTFKLTGPAASSKVLEQMAGSIKTF